ncbi:MAG: hypothetical protein IJD92_02340 [Bacilli bacterium]|nr:hypothetical protein [Bacilli bacterium]
MNKFRNFMYGRYGIDNLYNFLFLLYIVLNLFIDNKIINILELILIIYMFYRVLSKKIYKRNKENQIYLNIKKKILKPFNNIKRNIKDKDHIYKRCNKCKTTLKLPLPNKIGFHKAKCPKCKKIVTLFTLKKEKIEIISKK